MAKICLNCKTRLDKGNHTFCRMEYEAFQMTYEDWMQGMRPISTDFDLDLISKADLVQSGCKCQRTTYIYDSYGRGAYCTPAQSTTCSKCEGAIAFRRRYDALRIKEAQADAEAAQRLYQARAFIRVIKESWPEIREEVLELIQDLRDGGALPD